MNAYSRYKNRLERFLQTERGKRFINFAYSIGAAIVILGAMFKLLHFPFGNEMLFIGMMTEVVVFILSAFDRPVQDYAWEEVFPALSGRNPKDRSDLGTDSLHQRGEEITLSPKAKGPVHADPVSPYTHPHVETGAASRNNSQHFAEQVQETIGSRLSSSSEEYNQQMENLNRTLSSLNSIYEVQLKSISSQLGTIEQINQGLNRLRTVYSDALPDGTSIKEETEKMAGQLKELNEVYGRMLHAMTVNRGDNPANPRP